MEIPKFEILAGKIVNLNRIELIECKDPVPNQDVTIEDPAPWEIVVEIAGGKSIIFGYKNKADRDVRFSGLAKGLGAEK